MSYSIDELYEDIKSKDLEDFINKLSNIPRKDKANDFINLLIYRLAEDKEINYLEKIQELCYHDEDTPVFIIKGQLPHIEITGLVPDCFELKLKNTCKD